ncbi:MAG: hypothetical protein Q4F27_00175 [Desulfovibrionaceae bacterium]|nr:hypothetical protein [Desulfovibrionaceae bacterium]
MAKKSKNSPESPQESPSAPAAEAAAEAGIQVAAVDAQAPAREISPEEAEAMMQGRDRTHFEGLGDAWAVLTGHNPEGLMPQVVGTVLHEGGTRASWQWKRKGHDYVLMAWPQDQPVRASVLMAGKEGGDLRPVNAVPLLEGLPNDLTVDEVHPWENGAGADVGVSMMEGKNPMWFYDPLYGRDHDDLTPGITHTFLLAGLAYGLRKALLDEITITQGPRYEAYADAWLEENPGKSRLDVPPLKVSVAGRHMIMPGRRFCEYQMRGVVEEVQDCQLEKMPVKILYMRFPFEDRPPMRLPVYASKLALGEYDHQKGDEVDAYVWLQARVIDLDESPQQ